MYLERVGLQSYLGMRNKSITIKIVHSCESKRSVISVPTMNISVT